MSGTINNGLSHEQQLNFANDMLYAINTGSTTQIIWALSQYTAKDWTNLGDGEYGENETIYLLNTAAQIVGSSFNYNENDSLHHNIQAFWGALVESAPSVDLSTVTTLGTTVIAGTTLYLLTNGNWVKAAPAGTGAVVGNVALKSPELINELAESGAKYTADNVGAITKISNGQLVWLETGGAGKGGAGVLHILEEHATDFAAKGIESNQLPEFLMTAVSKGQVVGYQGQGTGRPIFEVMYNGVKQYVAITIGSNGFIVGANPTSLP